MVRTALAALILAGIAAAAGGAAGVWNCVALTPDGEALKFTLKIREEEGRISATVEDARGAAPVIDPKLEGATVSFKVDYDGSRYTMALKIEGDKLEGTYTGEPAAGKVTGARQK
jgi:hypothetical protein